jgi:hypothetical protein
MVSAPGEYFLQKKIPTKADCNTLSNIIFSQDEEVERRQNVLLPLLDAKNINSRISVSLKAPASTIQDYSRKKRTRIKISLIDPKKVIPIRTLLREVLSIYKWLKRKPLR